MLETNMETKILAKQRRIGRKFSENSRDPSFSLITLGKWRYFNEILYTRVPNPRVPDDKEECIPVLDFVRQ